MEYYFSRKLKEINFSGYAMGGLAVGESQLEMLKILNETTEYLPKNKKEQSKSILLHLEHK